jgi:hypothetical protein
MSTSCHEATALLLERSLDDLADEDAGRLDAHLASCADCRELAPSVDRGLEDWATVSTKPAPAGSWERLRAGLGDEAPAQAARVVLVCTFCHGPLARAEAAYCASCLAPSHVDCFLTHGRCPAPGCEETEIVRPRAPAQPVTKRGGRVLPALFAAFAASAGVAAAFTVFQRDLRTVPVEDTPRPTRIPERVTEPLPPPTSPPPAPVAPAPPPAPIAPPTAATAPAPADPVGGLSELGLRIQGANFGVDRTDPRTKPHRVSFTADGRTALLLREKTAILYSVERSAIVGTWPLPENGVGELGEDGSAVLLGTEGTAKLVPSGTIHRLDDDANASGMVYLAAKRRVLLAQMGSARLYDLDSGRMIDSFKVGGRLVSASPDGLAVLLDPDLSVIDIGTPRVMPDLGEKAEPNKTFAETPDLSVASSTGALRVLTGGPDGRLVVHDLEARTRLGLVGHTGDVLGVAIGPGGRLGASVGLDRTVRLWDLEQGTALAALDLQRVNALRNDWPCAVAFFAGEAQLAVGMASGTMLRLEFDRPVVASASESDERKYRSAVRIVETRDESRYGVARTLLSEIAEDSRFHTSARRYLEWIDLDEKTRAARGAYRKGDFEAARKFFLVALGSANLDTETRAGLEKQLALWERVATAYDEGVKLRGEDKHDEAATAFRLVLWLEKDADNAYRTRAEKALGEIEPGRR